MNYVEGVDVSKWQGLMQWQVCHQAGARFAFIRAGSIANSSGVCYKDNQFDRNASLAPAIMPVGFYFYMRPNHNAYKQAEYFWGLIEDKNSSLPSVVDIEDPGGQSRHDIQVCLRQFIERLSTLSGAIPIIYTSPGFANQFLGAPGWLGEFPLWVANWRTGPPVLPIAWDRWLFHQWSADGNRKGHEYGATGSHDIDLNRFNGDAEDFAAYIEGEIPAPPDPDEEFLAIVDPEECRFLYIRSDPKYIENEANVIGSLGANMPVTVLDDTGTWWKVRVPEFTGFMHRGFLKRV